MRVLLRISLIGTVLLILTIISATTAQQARQDMCPKLVNQALMSLDATCSAMARNTACYGNSDVSATFVNAADHTAFTHPADRIELTQLKSIQTSPLDEAQGKWGLAMLNVDANVPNTLPGQGVIFILMGDARIENQVTTATVPDRYEMVNITLLTAANMRLQPNKKARITGSVPAGTVLQTDFLSADGKWLRVMDSNGVPAWVHGKLVQDFEKLPAMPRLDQNAMSLMQVFQFTGGIGQNQCQQSQGSLLIQGPNEMIVHIEVNGVQINIGSTILVTKTADNDMQVTVLSGEANVDGVAVPAGYFTKAALGANNRVESVFSPAAPITMEQYQSLQIFGSLPTSVVHYQPKVPVPELNLNPAQSHGNQGKNSKKDSKKDKDKKDKPKPHPDHPNKDGHGDHHD